MRVGESMAGAEPIIRTVADTMIYLEASISEANVSSSFLRRVAAGEAVLYVSDQLLEEVRDVLTRPELRQRNARLSDEALEGFLTAIEQGAVRIDPLPVHFRYERDPDDEHVVNLAIQAKARYLVTHDNDLLDLMDQTRPEGKDFRRLYPDLTVLGPGDFIHHLNVQRDLARSQAQETSPGQDQAPQVKRPSKRRRRLE